MNLEALRGHHAFASIQNLPPASRSDFPSLARQLPQMLQVNGLLASWAFLLAKGKPQHRAALAALVSHLAERGLVDPEELGRPMAAVGDSQPDSITASPQAAQAVLLFWLNADHEALSSHHLRRLTAEAIAYAGWLRKAAEALLLGAPSQEASGAPEEPTEPETPEESGS